MKKLLFILFGLIPLLTLAQVTTSNLDGRVVDEEGEPLDMVNVVAKHEPTGTVYYTTTRPDGRYNINNVRVGGPYTITASLMGYKEQKIENVTLQLGKRSTFNFIISLDRIELQEAVVTYNNDINTNKKGTETTVGEVQLNEMPTISREVSDFVRLNPQSSVQNIGGQTAISVAGINNRYNSIFIDGAVNNDVFGLSATGANGGQTGGSPLSLDAIEEIQVVVAPYDVKLSGFAGGGINAVTRSGSNVVEGSAYYIFRNHTLAGKTPTDLEDAERTSLPNFASQIFGVRVGAPIIKDKLFVFASAEIQNDNTPRPVQVNENDLPGDLTLSDVNSFIGRLNEFGYDPGTWNEDVINTLESQKFLLKLDWNINEKNSLTLRHSYTKNVSETPGRSTLGQIAFSNSGVNFPSTTNSSALELNSRISNSMSNNLIIGFTNVNDDRGPIGDDFPYVSIAGNMVAGSEQFSTGNVLNQSIFTLTDNFEWFTGKHHFTFGTHNEYYDIRNVFIRQGFGSYNYDSTSQFTTGMGVPTQYDISYSLNPADNGLPPDESSAAAEFNVLQLGFYVQDEYRFTERFKLTGGIRFDIPIYLDDPADDGYFNTTAAPAIESFGYDLKGAQAGQAPKPQLLVSPRIGFNYDIRGDQSLILRGGLGIFTSRIPYVWPGAMYNNNGATVGGLRTFTSDFVANGLGFNSNPANQYRASDFGRTDAIPQGQMDLFASNFKFPQVFRSNIAVDKTIFWGMIATVDVIFTQTINNIFYENINIKPSVENITGSPDNRPYFDRTDPIDDNYTGIYLASNTNKGYTFNTTLQLVKQFDKGLSFTAAYNYGLARSVYDGTSSQNSSQWRGINSVPGRNEVELGISDYDMGHRVLLSGAYVLEYANRFATTFSLFFNGQSGMRHSYIYDDNGGLTNEDSRERNLIYVPRDQSEINLVDYTSDGVTVTAEEQWEALNRFIEDDNYLKDRRGNYAERNGARTPFETVIDLRIVQDIIVFKAKNGRNNKIQITFDVFNFTNLLNKNWGRRYFVPNRQYQLIRFEGFETGTRTPTFTYRERDQKYDILDQGVYSSRWQAQLGFRYTF
jgi:hypothetical protein